MITFEQMPYERLDMNQVRKDFADLTGRLGEAKSGAEQYAVHEEYYRIYGHIVTEVTLAEIRHDIDMTDEFYRAEQDFYDANMPEIQNLNVAYQKKLYESPYRPYLEEKIGKVAFKNIELAMASVDEKILPLMQEENRLQSGYNRLLATAQIEWGAETLNLSLMNPYLHSPDRKVRIRAWEKYSGFFAQHREELDDFYDRLVRCRTQQAQALGHETYLPLGYSRMMRNCYGREEIAEFRKQVRRDFVPFAEKLHERRRRRLGLARLHFEDEGVYFPEGNPAPSGTPQQILEAGRKMYHELSPETGEFMDFMCGSHLFDVAGRKTKKTGGYMTYLDRKSVV